MPLYMDFHHKVEELTHEAIARAHAKDLEAQDKHGVKYLQYWYDEGAGKIFCLCEAPSKDAAEAVHREANGVAADEIFEVKEGT
jgi:Nickel responsive protein SCO4226-like